MDKRSEKQDIRMLMICLLVLVLTGVTGAIYVVLLTHHNQENVTKLQQTKRVIAK